jgi:hypothetical protein
MVNMRKLILTSLLLLVTQIYFVPVTFAQSATDSATATDEAEASDSATATESSSLPETLPETGAADVFIMFGAGLIFLYAGATTALGTKKVFTEIE